MFSIVSSSDFRPFFKNTNDCFTLTEFRFQSKDGKLMLGAGVEVLVPNKDKTINGCVYVNIHHCFNKPKRLSFGSLTGDVEKARKEAWTYLKKYFKKEVTNGSKVVILK